MTYHRAFDASLSLRDRFLGAALVTGASAGIGEAFARTLAARGMDVVLVARRGDRLASLARELEAAHGVTVAPVALDLAAPEVHRTLPAAVKALGLEVGLLINNAGFGLYGEFAELSADDQARMVDLNCRTPVLLTHAFLPAMRARGAGGVVIVSSVAGYQPTPFYTTYGATKAFDLMLAEALWAELRDDGIAVLALSPGNTPTEFQAVAGVGPPAAMASPMTTDSVVRVALDAIGHVPSVIPGTMNTLMASGARFLPRRVVAALAKRANTGRALRKGPTP